MMFTFRYGFIHLRHVSFSEGTHIMPDGEGFVNAGGEIAPKR
jgi:hypothetical protein